MLRQLTAAQLRRLLPPAPGPGPAYQWLANALRVLILDGRLPLGTRVPAERELARALGVSRTTTGSAYDLLRREGYLTSRRGAGTFASFPPEPAAALPSWFPADPAEGVIDLTVAAPTAPRDAVMAAAAAAVEQLPRHLGGDGYRVLGLPELREAVAERYRRRGLPTGIDEVMITSGAQGALSLLARVLLSPGAAVLVESPTYPNALDTFRAASARLVTVPLDRDWDVELIEAGLRQTLPALTYVIPDFHNPTGLLMSSQVRGALVRAARAVDSIVVSDESYLALSLQDGLAEPEPLAAHDPDRVISVGSLGKCVWGGLRVGWIRASPSLVQRLASARPSLDLAGPLLEQEIALGLVDRLDELVGERRRRLAVSLDARAPALSAELPAWTFARPQGGLSLWITVDRSTTSLTGAAAGAGVRIVPGPRFGVDGTLERFLRLPFVLPPPVLREAVARLARAAEEVPPLAERAGEVSYVV